MTRLVLASASPRRRELLGNAGYDFEVVPSGVDEDAAGGSGRPERVVRRIARAKALDVAIAHPDAAVLAADTIVVLQGDILNKPADAEEARLMLERLRDRWHRVITAVAVVAPVHLSPAQSSSMGASLAGEGAIGQSGNRATSPTGEALSTFGTPPQRPPTLSLSKGEAPSRNQTPRRLRIEHVVARVRMRDYPSSETEAWVTRGGPFDRAGAYAIQDPVFQPVREHAGCYCNVVGLPLWTARRLLTAAGVEPLRPTEAPSQCEKCPLRVTASPT